MKDTKPKKPDPSRQNIQTNPKYGENSVIFQLKENHIASQPVAISCILIPWFPEYQTPHLQTMHEAKDTYSVSKICHLINQICQQSWGFTAVVGTSNSKTKSPSS